MTGTIEMLFLSTVAFLAIHIIPSSFIRAGLTASIGERAYMILYSLLSVIGLVWMVMAYGAAPEGKALWDAGNGARYAGSLLMVIAFIFMVSAYTSKNPTGIGMDRFVNDTRVTHGFIAITRHPLMWAIIIWAFVHTLNKATITAVIFFGGLGLLALAGTLLIDRKKAEQMPEKWPDFASRTSNIPFLAILQGRAALSLSQIWWRVVLGALVFAAFYGIHAVLFGVSPYPV